MSWCSRGAGVLWLLVVLILAPGCPRKELVGPEDVSVPVPVAAPVPVPAAPSPPASPPPSPPAPERVPPKPQVPEDPPKPAPETGADAPAQAPRLLPDPATGAGEASGDSAVQKVLSRVEGLLGILRQRVLTRPQREERDAGATFMAQAREALAAGDPARAAVLAEKSVALIENLELATRP